ncbi:hypothetical protein QAD02_002990 [Eretmocerus hayati]|uniref:Uncharacterized protein n=1 Tax=Eretmocerus hayati TaxID=131215 RepID=A0ACC2NLF0_9HYME|nr:hypothetical protein QAD02_002990 [Eretmocerus hayati]
MEIGGGSLRYSRPRKAKESARGAIRKQVLDYHRVRRDDTTRLVVTADGCARTREFPVRRPPIVARIVAYSRSVGSAISCQLMSVEIALVPELPEEKLIELHYYKAVKLCEAFRQVQNKESSVYFYRRGIYRGSLNHISYKDERLFDLTSKEGHIFSDTFYNFPCKNKTLVNLKKAAETIYASVYTHWRLWSDITGEYYVDHFLITRIPNNLLKGCPVTEIDLDRNILSYLRTLRFYKSYRELSDEIKERIRVESFCSNVQDSAYVIWRGHVLHFNHLSPRYEDDTVIYSEFTERSLAESLSASAEELHLAGDA